MQNVKIVKIFKCGMTGWKYFKNYKCDTKDVEEDESCLSDFEPNLYFFSLSDFDYIDSVLPDILFVRRCVYTFWIF